MDKSKSLLKLFALLFVLSFIVTTIELALRVGGLILSYQQEEFKPRGENSTYRILALGESTTFSTGDEGWPEQLEKILNEKSSQITFEVVNKGLPAANSTIILSLLEKNLDTYNPNLVAVMMGINDTEIGDGFIPYDIKESDTRPELFIKNLRIYKFLKFLLNFASPKAKAQQKSNALEHINLGDKFIQEGNLPKAEDAFNKALEIEPQSSNAHIGLARIYRSLGEYNKSEKSLLKALSFQQNNDFAYELLGNVYRETGRIEKAERMYLKAVEINSQNSSALVELGHMYTILRNYSQARMSFEKALQINPNDLGALLKLGALYVQNKDFFRAEVIYKRAISLPQKSYMSFFQLAHLYREQGKESEAKELEKEAESIMALTNNYRRLRDVVKKRGIKLAAIQYPTRSIIPLKEILQYDRDVIFVDNETIFKQAVSKDGYEEYFIDNFAGDFGHATPKGNLLLAQNIANTLIQNIFK